MLFLLDSGILLRLVNRSDPEHATVRAALRLLKRRGDSLITAPQNLAEFWNVCTRPASARGGYGLSVAETALRLKLLERLFNVLPDTPAAYPVWKQLVVAHGVMGVQVHDARLVALMVAQGIQHILTLNTADFTRYPMIVAHSPADVLDESQPKGQLEKRIILVFLGGPMDGRRLDSHSADMEEVMWARDYYLLTKDGTKGQAFHGFTEEAAKFLATHGWDKAKVGDGSHQYTVTDRIESDAEVLVKLTYSVRPPDNA